MGQLYDLVSRSNGNPEAYKYGLSMITRERRIPYSLYLQLTPYCNLRCRMCYARMEPEEVLDQGKHILSFEEWKYFIDEGMKLGSQMLVLTGGESTLHPAFEQIYSYAYDAGMELYVMTNLTNITESIFRLWLEKPPASISFTVYGASAGTYASLCGKADAFSAVYANIEKLMDAGVNLFPKFNAVHDNFHDIKKVREYFKKRHMDVTYGGNLMNFGKCNGVTIEQEKIENELFSEFMFEKWCEDSYRTYTEGQEAERREIESRYLNRGKYIKGKGLQCGAARNTCHINWMGQMTPCVALDAYKGDPRKEGFQNCWTQMCSWADEVPEIDECGDCIFKSKCISCVAYHYQDTGTFGQPSPRLCWKRNHPEKAAEMEADIIRRVGQYES